MLPKFHDTPCMPNLNVMFTLDILYINHNLPFGTETAKVAAYEKNYVQSQIKEFTTAT